MMIKEKGGLLMMGQRRSRLPDEYQELAFIGSRGAHAGAQFSNIQDTEFAVDTGFSPDWDTKIWVRASIARKSTTQFMVGLYVNSIRYDIAGSAGNAVQYNLNANNVASAAGGVDGNVHDCWLDAKNGIAGFDDTTYTLSFTKSGSWGGKTLTLFIRSEPAVVSLKYKYQTVCDVYGFKAWKNGILSRDMIPAERKSDGVLGLYDMCGSVCSKTGTPFYVNYGRNTFYKGAYI